MSKIFWVLFICTGLVFGCNSNKPTKGGHGKKGKHRSGKQYASNNNNSSGSTAGTKTAYTLTETGKSKKVDYKSNSVNNPNSRPGYIHNGFIGDGSGGSYASGSYKQDRMKKLERKELYKQRTYLYNDNNEYNMSRNNATGKDTTMLNSDSTSVQMDEWSLESDSTSIPN